MITFSDGTQFEDEASMALGMQIPDEEAAVSKAEKDDALRAKGVKVDNWGPFDDTEVGSKHNFPTSGLNDAIKNLGWMTDPEPQSLVNRSHQAKNISFDTPLNDQEETKFQEWKQKYAPNDSGQDYDLRGAFKSGLTPDADTGHWPDTYKKPNHPTFSDQSIYAKDRPDLAGRWEGETYIPPITKDMRITPLGGPTPTSWDKIDDLEKFPQERGLWNILTGADNKERMQLLPEKMFRESITKLGRSFDTIKDIMEGRREASSEEGVGAVTNITSALMTNGLMSAPFRGNSLGTFGGAIGSLRSKEAFDMRDKFFDLQARGEHTPEEMFKSTGWFRDPRDGKMKFEIPDGEAVMRWKPRQALPDAKEGVYIPDKLGDVLEHPLLYKIYPEIKDIPIVRDPNMDTKKALAMFIPPQTLGGKPTIVLSDAVAEPNMENTSILLHEIQHWIQEKEGFAKGSNPEWEYSKINKLHPLPEEVKNAQSKYIELLSIPKRTPSQEAELKDIREKALSGILLDSVNKELAATKYRNAGGEIESRNVQRRYEYDQRDGLPEDAWFPPKSESMPEYTPDLGWGDFHFNQPKITPETPSSSTGTALSATAAGVPLMEREKTK